MRTKQNGGLLRREKQARQLSNCSLVTLLIEPWNHWTIEPSNHRTKKSQIAQEYGCCRLMPGSNYYYYYYYYYYYSKLLYFHHHLLLLCALYVVSFKWLDVLLIAHPLATIYLISFLLLFDLAQLKQRRASQIHQNNLYGSLGHINRVHEPHGFNYEEQYFVRHWKGKSPTAWTMTITYNG